MYRVFDLHADLLYFLAAKPGRSPLQSQSRCALHQLRSGGVDLQVLPIFTMGGSDAIDRGEAQARWFVELASAWRPHYRSRGSAGPLVLEGDWEPGEGPVAVIPAVENASAFVGEDELLAEGLARLDGWVSRAGPFLYVSLTWRGANRFGGGDGQPDIGLLDDGRRLLEGLATRVPAVDLSHASDRLAEEVLGFIEAEGVPLVPIASHSNFRGVTDHRRNLPDWLASEIVTRGGIIGLNVVRDFVGSAVECFVEHVAYANMRGWGDGVALGSDFFWEGDLPSGGRLSPHRFFFPGFEDASCHPALQSLVRSSERSLVGQVGDPSAQPIVALAHGNLAAFLRRVGFVT